MLMCISASENVVATACVLPSRTPCCAAGLTATQLALLGVTADAPQGGEPPEVAQKMAQDRYWQHVALRDSLPHVSGAPLS
jgi:hypothetical protein